MRKKGKLVSRNRFLRAVALLVAVSFIVGCAAQKSYRRGEMYGRRGNWDQAVIELTKAANKDPGNSRYSVALERAKLKASAEHFQKGKRLVGARQYEAAIAEFQQTLLLNPGNQHAVTELERAARELQKLRDDPSQIQKAKEAAARRQLGPPKLDPQGNIEIMVKFIDQPVEKIFEAISKASGVNFIFDEKTDLDKPLTVDIGSVTVEQALDILMLQTKNFYKVVDAHTLLIAPDSRQKRQEYEDHVIRTFYLSNGDTKQVVTLLRSLLQSRQIAENTDLNSVTIKDTPDKVAIADRIIQANDKSKGEVLIDVELLEINRSVVQQLGLDLSSKTLSLSFSGADGVALNNLDSLKQEGNWSIGPIPSVVLNFLKSDSETRSIAKPSLRVTEGEKAEILIGDRVPIPTVSFNTSQTVGGNIVPLTSFTYQNVGITVQLEPRVHHNKEITLKVQVEISSIGAFIDTGGGQSQPIIGTRNIQTVIRLRDGETNMLAGLIRTTEEDSVTGVPGLLDVPGLNKVFGNNSNDTTEQDIVLTLTPHIVRIPDITDDDLVTLWVGTEENMQMRGAARTESGVSPFGRPEDFGGEAAGTDPALLLPGGGRSRGVLSKTLPSPSGGGGARSGGGAAGGGRARPTGDPSAGGSTNEQGGALGVGGSGQGNNTDPGQTDPAGDDPAQDDSRDDRNDEDDDDRDRDRASNDEPGDEGEEEEDEPAGPMMVRLVPDRASYRAGETINVSIVLENGKNVGSAPFHLRYDRGIVEFVGAAEGNVLNGDGQGTIFLAQDAQGGGEVVVGHSRLGSGTGIDGSGTLSSMQFLAMNPGNAGFVFSRANLKNPQAQTIQAVFMAPPVLVAD
ncbi:hypothetical protein ABI59_02085 [Acidobacteria bacterium Mor1]|nr:hypothetical protein ABI59_02085 [Acidobacteria bacterium Mor1]